MNAIQLTTRLVAACAALSMVVMPTGCRRNTDTGTDMRAATTGVTVQPARVENLRDVVTASGTVVPSSAADWTIYAPENGEVSSLPVKEEDAVTPGTVLVRFEIASVEQQNAALQLDVLEATNRVERAKKDLSAKQMLYDRGMMARNDYEASKLEQATAESLLTQARTRLELASTEMDRSTVRATFAGKVIKVWHTPGDMVSGGVTDPVLRVIDPSRVQVSVQLPVAQLARIVPGQAAVVRSFAGPGDEAATVALKMDVSDPTAPTGEVRLSFTNPATQPLDTPVSVEILLDQRTGALVVPTSSIRRDPLAAYVMVAGPDGLAHRRDVHTGLVTKELTQVIDGITAGDQVIVGGLEDVNDGTPVAISR